MSTLEFRKRSASNALVAENKGKSRKKEDLSSTLNSTLQTLSQEMGKSNDGIGKFSQSLQELTSSPIDRAV